MASFWLLNRHRQSQLVKLFSKSHMYLFVICCVATPENPWKLFTTEKEILQACAICTKYFRVRSSRNVSNLPQENTECAKDTNNRFCSLIRVLNESSPDYCAKTGPCVPQKLSNYRGMYCYGCRFISSYLMLFDRNERLSRAYSLCANSRAFFSEFCAMMTGDTMKTYVNALTKLGSTMEYCVKSRMCKPIEPSDEL